MKVLAVMQYIVNIFMLKQKHKLLHYPKNELIFVQWKEIRNAMKMFLLYLIHR